jgi:hypothetical protein
MMVASSPGVAGDRRAEKLNECDRLAISTGARGVLGAQLFGAWEEKTARMPAHPAARLTFSVSKAGTWDDVSAIAAELDEKAVYTIVQRQAQGNSEDLEELVGGKGSSKVGTSLLFHRVAGVTAAAVAASPPRT